MGILDASCKHWGKSYVFRLLLSKEDVCYAGEIKILKYQQVRWYLTGSTLLGCAALGVETMLLPWLLLSLAH